MRNGRAILVLFCLAAGTALSLMTLHPHLGGGVPSTVRRATVWLSGNTTRVLWHNAAAAAASAAGRLHLDRAAAARGGDAAAADAAAAPHHAAPKKNKRGGGRLKRTVRKGVADAWI